jgi:hypothetical protein
VEALWLGHVSGYLLCGGVHLLEKRKLLGCKKTEELGLVMVGRSKSVVGGGNMLMHGLAQQSKVKFQMMTISF